MEKFAKVLSKGILFLLISSTALTSGFDFSRHPEQPYPTAGMDVGVVIVGDDCPNPPDDYPPDHGDPDAGSDSGSGY